MIFIALAFVGFLLSVIYCAAEAWYERDWPRVMAKYIVIFALLVFGTVAVFGQVV